MEAGQFGNKILAVIPARGGSKRVPRKNIIPFRGKPMIQWTIEAAKETGLFADILVSTDDEEIASISRIAGALVPFLRETASDDYSTVSEATISAVKQMEVWSSKKYDTVVQLMANCPVRESELLKKQVEAYYHNNKNSLLTCFEYGMFNPWWAHRINDKGIAEPVFSDLMKGQRSQDLPELVCPSGATWISDKKKLLKYNSFYSPNYSFFKINWIDAIDIDNLEDLMLAEVAYSLKHGK